MWKLISVGLGLAAINGQKANGQTPSDNSLIDCFAPCDGDLCTYHVNVNLFAGELGYYTFEECGDKANPTIAMQKGKIYRFVQSDRSNYYHPLGFAYYPDGAHDDVDELEPGIAPPGSSSRCAENESCPAPMYVENGKYLGRYMNLPTLPVAAISSFNSPLRDAVDYDFSVNTELEKGDFGLDHYEPKFFYPIGDWLGFGTFEILLHFGVTDFTQDIFYFCHIHQFMSGRIKFVDENNQPISKENKPPIEYEYDEISSFDEKCGTFNTSSYQLPNAQCPEKFVCDVATSSAGPSKFNSESSSLSLADFSTCLDAMNCAMMAGMTSHATSEIGLFVHQMIPHHQNAVNMGKALLKTSAVACEDLSNEDDPKCIMQNIVREIINGQNYQIQSMRGVLEALNEPAYADCVVPVLQLPTSQNGNAAITEDVKPVNSLDDSAEETPLTKWVNEAAEDEDSSSHQIFRMKDMLVSLAIGSMLMHMCNIL